MFRTAACLAILVGSITLIAQNSATSSSGQFEGAKPKGSVPQPRSLPGSAILIYPSIVANCPIDMHATQGVWDRTIRVRDGDKERVTQPFGQRISLNLKDARSSRIVSATVRVRGLNGNNRTLPTPANTARRWNAVRTLRVRFGEESDGTVSADLWIVGFTSVGSIELMNVSYSDGSVWTISESGACRVEPDPIVLITER